MKFGKSLLHEMDNSNPEWGPFWMNYKGLKKHLKLVIQPMLTTTTDEETRVTQSSMGTFNSSYLF